MKKSNLLACALLLVAFTAIPSFGRSDDGPAPISDNPEPAGSCPTTNNACMGPDGCFAIQQSVYREYTGMAQCTYGLSGCDNTISRLCYTAVNVQNCETPPAGSTGRDSYENACS